MVAVVVTWMTSGRFDSSLQILLILNLSVQAKPEKQTREKKLALAIPPGSLDVLETTLGN